MEQVDSQLSMEPFKHNWQVTAYMTHPVDGHVPQAYRCGVCGALVNGPNEPRPDGCSGFRRAVMLDA